MDHDLSDSSSTSFHSCKIKTEEKDVSVYSNDQFEYKSREETKAYESKILNKGKQESRNSKIRSENFDFESDVQSVNRVDGTQTKQIEPESRFSASTAIRSDANGPSSSRHKKTTYPDNTHAIKKETKNTINGYKIGTNNDGAKSVETPKEILDSFSKEYRKVISNQIRHGKQFFDNSFEQEIANELKIREDWLKSNELCQIIATSSDLKNKSSFLKVAPSSKTLSENFNLNRKIPSKISSDTFSDDETRHRLSNKYSKKDSGNSEENENRKASKQGSAATSKTGSDNTRKSEKISSDTFSDDETRHRLSNKYSKKASVKSDDKGHSKTSKQGSVATSKAGSQDTRENSKLSKAESRASSKSGSKNRRNSENSKQNDDAESTNTSCQRVFKKEGDEFKCVDEELEKMLEESSGKSRKSSSGSAEGECMCDTGNDEVKNIAHILQSLHQPKKELCAGALPAVLGDFIWDQMEISSDKRKSQSDENYEDTEIRE